MNVLQLQVTDKCCNDCHFCFRRQGCGNIFWPLFQSIIEQIQHARKHNRVEKVQLVITGGDPLLLPADLLLAMVKQANDSFDRVSINTSFCEHSVLPQLFGQLIPKQTDIMASLHAAEPKLHDRIMGRQGSFVDIMSGLQLCRKAGLRAGINMVVDDNNWLEIEATAKLAREIGVSFFFASPEVNWLQRLENSRLKDFFLRLKRIDDTYEFQVDTEVCVTPAWFKENGLDDCLAYARPFCPAIEYSLYVAGDGNVYPCTTSSQVLGNLRSQGLVNLVQEHSTTQLVCDTIIGGQR